MAALDCTRSSMINGANCFNDFTPKQQRAIILYQLAYTNLSSGGLDYITDPGLLLTDSNNATCGMTESNFLPSIIAILNNEVQSGNFSFSMEVLTRATAMTAITCFKDWSERQIQMATLFLICKIRGNVT